jgi:hypothetical protein
LRLEYETRALARPAQRRRCTPHPCGCRRGSCLQWSRGRGWSRAPPSMSTARCRQPINRRCRPRCRATSPVRNGRR